MSPQPSPKSLPAINLPSQALVLVGLMGAGKSTIGRRLAKSLGRSFKDSDQEITEAAGCSISDLFEIHGEDIFRDLEQRVMLRLLTENTPGVLATGGGAFINPVVRQLIKEKGISIWLRADLEILVERVSRRNTRPMLEHGDKRDIMGKLMHERYPIYAEAHFVVDSDAGSHESVVEKILAALRDRYGEKP